MKRGRREPSLLGGEDLNHEETNVLDFVVRRGRHSFGNG